MATFNLSDYSANSVYHLMTQTVVPRPIAWILTGNSGAEDSYNLAPFSYFTALASDPPLIVISIGKKSESTLKDTRKNILDNKDFVIHIASRGSAENMTKTAASLDYGSSELEHIEEELKDFPGSPLPRLGSCKVAMHCEYYDCHSIGPNDQAVIYGQIRTIFVDDSIVEISDKRVVVDAKGLDPLARLGGSQYSLFGDIKEVKRPG